MFSFKNSSYQDSTTNIHFVINYRNISRAVEERSTNNYAEIKAVTEAAKQASRYGVKKLKVNTDSKFLINCLKEWMPKWKKNGWRTSSGEPVINKTELLELESQLKKFDNVEWVC